MAERGAVVITGASTGIGEACALRLARMGFQVYAGVRRDADGERLRERAKGALHWLHLDVTDTESIAAATARVEADGAPLAGLVNNAGISVPGPLELVPLDDLRWQLEVNVVGQVAVTQAFLPLLRRDHGRIVNIGSISGLLATPFVGAYAASKFALEAVSDAIRIELRPWDIPVVLVQPGSIATPIWEKGQIVAADFERIAGAEGVALYGEAVAAMREAARQAAERGLPPAAVARTVARALTARRPRTRYLVGTDARVQALAAALVPDRLRDRLLARYLHLPSHPGGAGQSS